MPGRMNLWLTDAAAADLEALQQRWGLPSRSATIARALAEANAAGLMALAQAAEETRT